jgi:hypothetical protein
MSGEQAFGRLGDHVAFVRHPRFPHLTPALSSPEERENIEPSPPGRRGWRTIASRVRWFRSIIIIIVIPTRGR